MKMAVWSQVDNSWSALIVGRLFKGVNLSQIKMKWIPYTTIILH